MKPTKLPPAVCQVIYLLSVISAALIPVLVTVHWLDPETGAAVDKFIGALAVVATGGSGLAAVRVGRQISAGTFAVPGGTSAEQLAMAAQNYVADEAKRQGALTDALRALPSGSAIAEAVRAAIGSAPVVASNVAAPDPAGTGVTVGDAVQLVAQFEPPKCGGREPVA